MKLPKLDTANGPDVLFDAIRDYVAYADAQVEKREEVDLTGLDIAIRALCEGVMELPVGEAKAYNEKLAVLMEEIEAMQQKMVTLQGEIATTMKSLGAQKKAAKAYMSTPGVKEEK